MTQNKARRAYSAEQLLALRESASDEPALKIETKAEESAIKGMFDLQYHRRWCQATSSTKPSDIQYIHRTTNYPQALSTRNIAASTVP